MIYLSLYWLILIQKLDQTHYFIRHPHGYAWSEKKEEGTRFDHYKEAMDTRFLLLGRGERVEIVACEGEG